jgi:hypothetical protein
MRKFVTLFMLFIGIANATYFTITKIKNCKVNDTKTKVRNIDFIEIEKEKLKAKATSISEFLEDNHYNSNVCFLIDMSIQSSKKRFFVYNLKNDSIIASGLAAHGSCNNIYLKDAKFSNTPECGCSAKGKYKIGNKYKGRFGDAYKLYGLDSSNSNAYKRFIVLHSYSCVPDSESNQPICNSLGCPMVSYNFIAKISSIIEQSKQPILLWIFE